MRTRTMTTTARVLLLAALALGVFGSVATASAVTQGSGRWYWPTGTEDFGGMSPWWSYRGGDTRHLAQDMKAPCGSRVYAIGAGTVLESRYINGYGPGGSQGGAVVILHRTAMGQEFKALYGHLKDLRYEPGDVVAAGAVIGLVNGSSPNHVHFGIHPGRAYPSDGNVFRGHTYDSDVTYGWVDPVAFLRRNPRYIPYVAPALPAVFSRATTSTPLEPVAAAGAVWWREASAEATVTLRYVLATRTLEQVSAEETPPAHDAVRYSVDRVTGPRLTVRDLRPVVGRAVVHATPAWRQPAVVVGAVRNARGAAFQGARLSLERWSGSAWTRVATGITGTDGYYRIPYTPAATTQLRVRFAPLAPYAPSTSTTVTVAPHVGLGRPALSVASPRRGAAFRITSVLTPRHAASAVVTFALQRKAGGTWVSAGERRATLSDTTAGSVCAAAASCAATGEWRVRAVMPADAAHAGTVTAWRTFTVR